MNEFSRMHDYLKEISSEDPDHDGRPYRSHDDGPPTPPLEAHQVEQVGPGAADRAAFL